MLAMWNVEQITKARRSSVARPVNQAILWPKEDIHAQGSDTAVCAQWFMMRKPYGCIYASLAPL